MTHLFSYKYPAKSSLFFATFCYLIMTLWIEWETRYCCDIAGCAFAIATIAAITANSVYFMISFESLVPDIQGYCIYPQLVPFTFSRSHFATELVVACLVSYALHTEKYLTFSIVIAEFRFRTRPNSNRVVLYIRIKSSHHHHEQTKLQQKVARVTNKKLCHPLDVGIMHDDQT